MTEKDWETIGQNKTLQRTVLDDIFVKYLDYQELDKQHRQWNYTTMEPELFDHISVNSSPDMKNDFYTIENNMIDERGSAELRGLIDGY